MADSLSPEAGPRPIVGVDVDGVIAVTEPAAVPVARVSITAWGRWRRTIAVPVTARDVVAALAQRYDVVWISAWGHTAHTSLRPVLDLPAEIWPFVPVQFGKADALARRAAGRSWVLVHDGLDDVPREHAARVVAVDPRCGIGALDLARIESVLTATTNEGAPR